MRRLDEIYEPVVVEDDDDIGSNRSENPPLLELAKTWMSRRTALKGFVTTAAVGAFAVQKDLGIGAPWFDEDQASAVGVVVLGAGLDVVERGLPKQECLVGSVLESGIGDTAALVQPQDTLHAPEMAQRMARSKQGLDQLRQLGADSLRLGLRRAHLKAADAELAVWIVLLVGRELPETG